MANTEYKSYLVETLRKYRLDNCLMYRRLAEELELPAPTVSAWLNQDNYPSEIACSRLEKFLKGKGYISSTAN